MFETQTEDSIKQRMISNAPTGINVEEGDFFYDAISPAAIELVLAYLQMEEVLKTGFAETSYGEYLDRKAAERGLSRKPATKGSGQIEVTATAGTTINQGNVLATFQGNIRMVATETKVIGQTAKELITFENETAGDLGNILKGTVFVAPTAITGFTSATNPEQINAGTDEESDESLCERYLETAKAPTVSGNKNDYLKWAKDMAGVGDAKVFPLWNGNSTVKVLIIDSNKQPASSALVSEVQNKIDPGASGLGLGTAPVGAFCTVASAEGLNINVAATVVGVSASTVLPIFEGKLEEYLKSIAFVYDSVSYAHIGSILLDSISNAGGTDYTGMTVNGGTSNVQIGSEQVAVMGTVTLA